MTTVDPFLEKKWAHVYRVFFDINQSNTLEWQDFEMLIETIKQQRGAFSREYASAKTAMAAVWEGLLAFDVNKDNKVSIQEWNNMWQQFVKSDCAVQKWQQAYIQYMFQLFDTSSDLQIDKNEYAQTMAYYNVSQVEAIKCFDKMSTTPIDFKTFGKLWKEYFTSTDPEAPGNNLFCSFEKAA